MQIRMHWYWFVGVKLLCLVLFGQFSGLLSYSSVPDLRRLFFACCAASGTLLAIRYSTPKFFPAPRGMILIDFMFSFVSVALVRLSFRMIRERYFAPQARSHRRMRRVGVLRAGEVGGSLELRRAS